MKLEQAVKVCLDCRKEKMRAMTAKPLSAETPAEYLRSRTTADDLLFDRNQGAIPPRRISLEEWTLTVTGKVGTPLKFSFDDIRMRKYWRQTPGGCPRIVNYRENEVVDWSARSIRISSFAGSQAGAWEPALG